jgi:hypothetical protein
MGVQLTLEGSLAVLKDELCALELPRQFFASLLELRDADVELLDVVGLGLDHCEGLVVAQLQVVPLEELILQLGEGVLIEHGGTLHLIQPLIQLTLQRLVLLVQGSDLNP